MKVAASRDDGTGCLSWPDRPASWANAVVTSHNKDKTLYIFGTVSPQAECCDQAVSFCSLLAVSREAIELYDHVRSAAQLRRPHRILAGAHFHGSTPSTGYRLLLANAWIRVTASVPDPAGNASYDTVVVYVLDPEGRTLLARPFRV